MLLCKGYVGVLFCANFAQEDEMLNAITLFVLSIYNKNKIYIHLFLILLQYHL